MRLIIEVADMTEVQAELLVTELMLYARDVEGVSVGQAWVEE